MQANKAAVQGLQDQLAEQRTQFGAESTAQKAQVEGLQQSLAAKTQQDYKLAADHSNDVQVCFYIMYALMQLF
jgi:cell division septum initiation protein DivIVA